MLSISYVMVEDRLRSYLYYLGCLKSLESYKFDNNNIRKDVKILVNNYSGEKVHDLGITSITGKMLIKSIQLWFIDGYLYTDDSDYLVELASYIDLSGDSQEILDTLSSIRNWCDY